MNDRPYFRGNEIELTGCGHEAMQNSARYFCQSLQTKNGEVAPLPDPQKIKRIIKNYALVKVAKILSVTLLFAFASCGVAREHVPNEKLCLAYTKLARTLMTARQVGMPIEETLKETKSKESRQLAVIAYGRPRYLSEEYRQMAIDDFAAEVYVECMRP